MVEDGKGKGKADDESSTEFVDAFADLVSRRDYSGAMTLCRERLKKKPDDRYALDLRQTVQRFTDAADELEDGEDEDEELPPQLEEMEDKALTASMRSFETMARFLTNDKDDKDGDSLWALGEQAVGIFWDPGQISASDPHKERLREISCDLTARLLKRLKILGRPKPHPREGEMTKTEWLMEALGQLWWYYELDLPPDPWLLESCRQELASSGGSMETWVGYSRAGLWRAKGSELCDILTGTWTLERSLVCGILGDGPAPAKLEYGMAEVLAEITKRQLVEPPLEGFYDCFYLMTHVVYVLNCFNGHLPNYRADCPWIYAYLERCLSFWLREVRRYNAAGEMPAAVASQLWSAEAVDAVAESVDCLLGLGEPTEDSAMGEAIRGGIQFLLEQQDEDGLFFSPGAQRDPSEEYNHLHPSWTAVAALQALRRRVPGPSPRCAAWVRHVRVAAEKAKLSAGPQTSMTDTLPGMTSLADEAAAMGGPASSSFSATQPEAEASAGAAACSASSKPAKGAAAAAAATKSALSSSSAGTGRGRAGSRTRRVTITAAD